MTRPNAVEILQTLIQFNTTNPPGNERPCIEYIQGLLQDAGIQTSCLARDPDRPNLIARLPGQGAGPTLLLFGHIDVVTTAHQRWSMPPFGGKVHEGAVWGRGALDMKSGIAMMIDALLCMADADEKPPADVVLLVVSDEEAGGRCGAQFVVEEHPSLLQGVRYALGEFGGFPIYLEGVPIYLIQVSEKQPCWMELTLRGPAGHGALPMRDGTMAALGCVLTRLNQGRLPVHVGPITRQMVQRMSEVLPLAKRLAFRRLLSPRWTNRILDVLGDTGRYLEPLFRNTVNATMVRGGDKPNVVPAEVALGLDGRLLPGLEPRDLIGELERLLDLTLDSRVILYDEGPETVDWGMLPQLEDALRRAHPGCHVAPYLLPGSSDARFLARLGIQTYGFLPMNLPEGFDFFKTIHAADERIPVECVTFGARTIRDVLMRYEAGPITTEDPRVERSASAGRHRRP